MASISNILICAGVAVLLYFCLGLPLAVRVTSRPLAIMLAPGIGWAVHSVVALPLLFALGISRTTVIVIVALPLVTAAAVLWTGRGDETIFNRVSIAALAGAALLAFSVMAGVVPKISPEGVSLAAPIFDHSKVAMIDEMTRLGVPPGNPFFGGAGNPARLSYYYLWHFSGAELALLADVSGWEADAGLTWFTAFASLATMIGLAVWLSGRATSGLWVVVLAATASVRPLLYGMFGVESAEAIVGYRSGFGGWLFQTSWAPQHMAAAMCAVLAVFLLVETIERFSLLRLLLQALTMAAAFESSTWVGGIVLPLAAATAVLVLLARAEPPRRMRIAAHLAIAAMLAMLLIAPLLYDQLQMSWLRGGGLPIAIAPYEVLTGHLASLIGQIANLPAYWLIFLVVEFPAFYLTGLAGLFYVLRNGGLAPERRSMTIAFALLLAVSLCAAWLLESTLGDNNDLGWRAVLPAVVILIVFAAVGMSWLQLRPASVGFSVAAALVLMGVPDAVQLIRGNLVIAPNASSKVFAETPALWQAVRQYSTTGERVANNPLFMAHVTPWGANISWALLANRRSCYAGDAFSAPFMALSQARRDQIDAQFVRVFDGQALPGDIEQLAGRYDCDVAVVTPEDGAWNRDPFASDSSYRLAEGNSRWRIYKINKPAQR